MEERTDFYRLVGASIRRLRRDKGLNQAQLSNEIGLTRTSLVQIESGAQAISLYHVFLLSDVLGIPTSDLINTFKVGKNAFDFKSEKRISSEEKDILLEALNRDEAIVG